MKSLIPFVLSIIFFSGKIIAPDHENKQEVNMEGFINNAGYTKGNGKNGVIIGLPSSESHGNSEVTATRDNDSENSDEEEDNDNDEIYIGPGNKKNGDHHLDKSVRTENSETKVSIGGNILKITNVGLTKLKDGYDYNYRIWLRSKHKKEPETKTRKEKYILCPCVDKIDSIIKQNEDIRVDGQLVLKPPAGSSTSILDFLLYVDDELACDLDTGVIYLESLYNYYISTQDT